MSETTTDEDLNTEPEDGSAEPDEGDSWRQETDDDDETDLPTVSAFFPCGVVSVSPICVF